MPERGEEQGARGAGAHEHSGVKQQVAQGGHPRESQRTGQQGSEAWLGRQGTDREQGRSFQSGHILVLNREWGCSLAAPRKMPVLERRLGGWCTKWGKESGPGGMEAQV